MSWSVGCSDADPSLDHGSAVPSPEGPGSDGQVSHASKALDASAANADAGTEEPIVEPVSEADYYVRNQTAAAVSLAATDLSGGPVQLLQDRLAPGEEARIYHALEGTGGHVMPSNFFENFTVTSGTDVTYSGVRNEDWKASDGRYTLKLKEREDYSCTEDEDCTIKDVGNCCGYYPRCVNVDSPTPGPECVGDDGESLGGVCGWPDITHCSCVQNTCRSMQGDQEV
ncbi:MAG: hypothetical protein QM778_22125 [Myxococcales bacterium]